MVQLKFIPTQAPFIKRLFKTAVAVTCNHRVNKLFFTSDEYCFPIFRIQIEYSKKAVSAFYVT